jgi:hypothetical protein
MNIECISPNQLIATFWVDRTCVVGKDFGRRMKAALGGSLAFILVSPSFTGFK